MDSWCFSDGGGAGCFTRTLDSFGPSFCSTSSDDVLDSATIGGWTYFDSSDSDPLNYSDAPPIHEQIYQQRAALMECRGEVHEFGMASRSNSVTTEVQILLHQNLLQQSQMAALFPESPPLPPQRQVAQPPPSAAVAPASQHRGAQFPSPGSDEAAIMRAMMVVLSSAASSSSSASSPSVMSNPPQELSIPRHAQENANALTRAFRTYKSGLLAPEPEPKGNSCSAGGQRMIKKLILEARRNRSANGGGAEGEGATDRATNNHRHHMISERRRREKLNDSFHRLRMILPPTPKKDKASVLMNARNYLKTLRAQIMDLEEKNQRLETHVHEEEAREGSGSGSSGSVQVHVTKTCESASSELQQVNMRITVRVECDIVDLVLNVLECLKEMKAVGVASVDAYVYSPRIHLFARANLKLQIKRCDWNEALFHEAMNKAVDSVVSSPESIFKA